MQKTELPGHDCVSGNGNPSVAPIITSIAGVATGTIAGRNSFFKPSTGNALAGTDAEVAKMSESRNLISLKTEIAQNSASAIITLYEQLFRRVGITQAAPFPSWHWTNVAQSAASANKRDVAVHVRPYHL